MKNKTYFLEDELICEHYLLAMYSKWANVSEIDGEISPFFFLADLLVSEPEQWLCIQREPLVVYHALAKGFSDTETISAGVW